MKIVEKRPDREGSIKAVIGYIEGKGTFFSSGKRLWKLLIPDIRQSVRYEFSDANPNVWKSLNTKYLDWKTQHGFASTIGVMTGTLKRALTDRADITIEKKKLVWAVNENLRGWEGKRVGAYAKYFHKKRPIFQATRLYLKRTLLSALKKWVRMGTSDE